jgi:hypothetical protein
VKNWKIKKTSKLHGFCHFYRFFVIVFLILIFSMLYLHDQLVMKSLQNLYTCRHIEKNLGVCYNHFGHCNYKCTRGWDSPGGGWPFFYPVRNRGWVKNNSFNVFCVYAKSCSSLVMSNTVFNVHAFLCIFSDTSWLRQVDIAHNNIWRHMPFLPLRRKLMFIITTSYGVFWRVSIWKLAIAVYTCIMEISVYQSRPSWFTMPMDIR